VYSRLPDEVSLVGGRAPVCPECRRDLALQGNDSSNTVLDTDAEALAARQGSLRKHCNLGEGALGRTEQIRELADQVDAEIGEDSPAGLLRIEEPRRVQWSMMGEDRIGPTDAANRTRSDEPSCFID